MQKKFLSSLLITIFLNLLIKPISLFGIDATVQNKVGPEEYGLYFSLLNLSVILNMLLDLGINNYTTKRIAQRPEIAKRYFSKVFSFRLILFLIYFLLDICPFSLFPSTLCCNCCFIFFCSLCSAFSISFIAASVSDSMFFLVHV